MQGAGQIMHPQEQGRAVGRRNRAKLRNFEEQNKQYKREVQLNNAEWKNEVQVQDIEQDQIYQAMIQQWSEQDQQLDKIFAQGDQKIEKAIISMYENDYAGTGTGRTAARLAGKSAKKLGQYKSEVLHSMMMSRDEAQMNQEKIQTDAQSKSWNAYEKIRFSPIHGHTPMQPELEAKPGMGGLLIGLAGTVLTSTMAGMKLKAPKTGLGDTISKDALKNWSPNAANPWDSSGGSLTGGMIGSQPSYSLTNYWQTPASLNAPQLPTSAWQPPITGVGAAQDASFLNQLQGSNMLPIRGV